MEKKGATRQNEKMRNLFHRLSIHYRLLLSYSLTFIVISLLGSLAIYSLVRTTLKQNIENELKNSTHTILGMVKTAIDASIRNHLRAISENNQKIAAYFYHEYTTGHLSEKEAKKKAANVLLSQPIGKTGYLYCIDSNGVIQVHPKTELIGTDISDKGFARTQKEKKQGYIEYYWANPGEIAERPKALYMSYFAPWDWIVSASSYRDEFNELLSVDDFQNYILSIKFGKTGYPYVMDSKGNLIIHPTLQGTNIYQSQDDDNRMFIKEICEKKNGEIIYPWKNPGEKAARKKLVIFNYIPEMDWIVASSSYLEEFYRPLTTIGYTTLIAVLIMLVIIIPITWLISSRLARPLQEMITVFENGSRADFSKRLNPVWGGEMGEVAKNYNVFIDTLEKARQQLETSEEKFRSIFENSFEGIFQINLNGDLIIANPAMAAMFGFGSAEKLISETTDFWRQRCHNPAQKKEILRMLEENKFLYEYEIQLTKKDQKLFWCTFSAKTYKTGPGNNLYIEGFLSDITQRKIARQALESAHKELEQKVQQRTHELSNWIKDLEQKNLESALLRKMSELIQICHTSEEIYDVAQTYFIQFFPKTSGRLYVFGDDLAGLDLILSWGDETDMDMGFQTKDCWALRQGKPYLMQKSKNNLLCNHLNRTIIKESLCAPLVAQKNNIGLLHIQSNIENYFESRQSLALIITEHLALALLNMKLQESLRLQSIQDPLTGLYNRRFLDESLRREAYSMKRHNYAIGIIMMDIDFFKKINDTHGHECGDAILTALGSFLKDNTRGNDIACRYGGEEFVIILIKTGFKEAVQK
ncbi:MAG: cache domain-containing protein, partial [Proteobacteria bacterium]|nr:cache domain-containing protein [Pseudomonadota bacterium]